MYPEVIVWSPQWHYFLLGPKYYPVGKFLNMWPYLGKPGLMKIALLAFSMHFQCVDNALQRVDNGSKCICNVTQSIVKTLTMFNKCLRMDEKCFSTVGNFFQHLIQMQHKTLKTRPFRPVATKLTIHCQCSQ